MDKQQHNSKENQSLKLPSLYKFKFFNGEEKRMKNLRKVATGALALIVAGTVGCVKKRDDRYNQSLPTELQAQTSYLVGGNDGSVSDFRATFDGGNYIPETNSIISRKKRTLRTREIIARPSNTQSAKLSVEEGTDFFNDFGIVKYEIDYVDASDIQISDNLPLLGKANTTYDLVYELTESYLKMYKVGPESSIPFTELTYARQDLVPGKFAVPIWAIPITYMRDERVLNENNKGTNIIERRRVEIRNKSDWQLAQIYQLDMKGGQAFKALSKPDIFKKDYFKGEWYFYAVLSKARPNDNNVIVGGVINPVTDETRFESANRVKFEIKENEMIVYDLNIDQEIDANDLTNLVSALHLPIKNVSFRIDQKGRFERGLEEIEEKDKSWVNKPYIQFEWDKFTGGFYNGALSALLTKPSLSDFRIAKDYFSFVVRYEQDGVEYRYSFRRNNPAERESYTKRKFFEDDQSFFGYFSASRQDVPNFRNTRLEDVDKLTSLTRFNPKSKEIVFHLSNNSPVNTPFAKVIEDATAKALEYWDAAFKAAGTDITVRLDRSKRVDLGDHRYNIVNVIDSVYSTGGLLGYGPSLADPFSGEIISATSNVYVGLMRDSVAAGIRNYLLVKTGRIQKHAFDYGLADTSELGTPGGPLVGQKSSVNPAVAQFMPQPIFEDVTEEIHGKKKVVRKKLVGFGSVPNTMEFNGQKITVDTKSSFGKAMLSRSQALAHIQDRLAGNSLEAYKAKKQLMSSCEYHNAEIRSSRGLTQAIEKECPAVVELANSKMGQQITTDEDLNIVRTCAEKIMYVQFMQTTVHELGHNFGLNHNFRGSTETDPKKYWTKEAALKVFGKVLEVDRINEGEVAVSNSVMDYYSEDAGGGILQAIPGPYDIAAIKFGYADKIRLADGQYVDVKDKSVRTVIKDDITKLDRYSQCTDLIAWYGLDPMCSLHDLGRTPLEIVKNAKNRIHDALLVSMSRYDRRYAVDQFWMPLVLSLRYYEPVQKIYNYWRVELGRQIFKDDPYLFQFPTSSRAVQAYEQTLAQAAQRNPEFKRLYDSYKPARDEAFNFLTELAFLPNRYCVVSDPKVKVDAKASEVGLKSNQTMIELEFLRDQIRRAIDREAFVSINNCYDPAIKAFVKENYGYDVVSETGFSLNDVKYDVSDRAITRPIDESGTQFLRLFAMMNMSSRIGFFGTGLLYANSQNNIYPNYFDEPDFRLKAQYLFESRLMEGVRPQTGLISKDFGKFFDQKSVRRYLAEQGLLGSMFIEYVGSLVAADIRSSYRAQRYSSLVYDVSQTRIYGENTDGIQVGNTIIRPRNEASAFVRQMINEFTISEALSAAGGMSALTPQLKDAIKAVVVEVLPKDDDAAFSGADLLKVYERVQAVKILLGAIGNQAQNPGFADLAQAYLDEVFFVENIAMRYFFGEAIADYTEAYNALNSLQEQYADFKADSGEPLNIAQLAAKVPQSGTLVSLASQIAKSVKIIESNIKLPTVKVTGADYERNIKALEQRIGDISISLRASLKADAKAVYLENSLDLPTVEFVSSRFDDSYVNWKDRANWMRAPENQTEVSAFTQLLYGLLQSFDSI